MKYFTLSLFAAALLAYSSCSKDKTEPPQTTTCSGVDSSTNTYNLRIKGIMDTYCAYSPCHDATFGIASGGVYLHDYATTKTAFQTQSALCSIKHGSGCEPMPNTGGKLADSLITYIECWAQNGYAQ